MHIRAYRPGDEAALLRIWNAALPRDPLAPERWRAQVLADPAGPTGTQIAATPRGIVGYAQHRGEAFGPLGVHPEYRGRGIGKLLVAATLAAMLAQGCPRVTIGWTYDEAARLYAQFGLREARRYVVLQKRLAGDGDAGG